MSRRQKRAGTITLAIIFLVASLAVFAGGAADKTAAAGQADPVTMAVRDNYPGAALQDYAVKYIEERTRTKITFIRMLPDELEEKLNLLLASGERPDIVQFYADSFEYQLSDAGLLLPLNDVLNTKMPNLKKEWGEAVWKSMTHPKDGKIYAIPAEHGAINVHFATFYRKDWMAKLGLQIPVTIEDYFRVAVAVSKQDPDGNQKNDTYAFGNFQGYGGTRYFDHIFGAYGTHPQQWMEVGGKLVNGYVLPGAKDALKMMKRLYDAGAIDPEFITDDESRTDQKTKNGVFGATNNYVFMVDKPDGGYWKSFQANNPNGDWVQQPAPLTGGSARPIGQRMLGQRGWLKTALINGAKNTDAAARILDWWATDEGAKYYNLGLPNEDYREDADGKITKITPADQWPARSIMQLWVIGRDLPALISDSLLQAAAVAATGAVGNADDGLIVPERTKYEADLNIFSKEQFLKMTVGEIAIDGGFEAFVQAWNQRGGKELTDALNRAAGK